MFDISILFPCGKGHGPSYKNHLNSLESRMFFAKYVLYWYSSIGEEHFTDRRTDGPLDAWSTGDQKHPLELSGQEMTQRWLSVFK